MEDEEGYPPDWDYGCIIEWRKRIDARTGVVSYVPACSFHGEMATLSIHEHMYLSGWHRKPENEEHVEKAHLLRHKGLEQWVKPPRGTYGMKVVALQTHDQRLGVGDLAALADGGNVVRAASYQQPIGTVTSIDMDTGIATIQLM